MKRAALLFASVASVAALAACGGSAEPAASPSSAAPPSAAPSEATVEGGGADGNASHAGAPSIAVARGDLDRAEREVEAAQSDCATACRALASMERAAEHLCALDAGDECARAKQRVEAARERVRASCGGCQ